MLIQNKKNSPMTICTARTMTFPFSFPGFQQDELSPWVYAVLFLFFNQVFFYRFFLLFIQFRKPDIEAVQTVLQFVVLLSLFKALKPLVGPASVPSVYFSFIFHKQP